MIIIITTTPTTVSLSRSAEGLAQINMGVRKKERAAEPPAGCLDSMPSRCPVTPLEIKCLANLKTIGTSVVFQKGSGTDYYSRKLISELDFPT